MPYINDLCGLCQKLSCEYKLNEPLKNHTTFKIGGSCKILVLINSKEALKEILEFVRNLKLKYFVLGKGSNVLAADDGFDGVIIKISNTQGSDFIKHGIEDSIAELTQHIYEYLREISFIMFEKHPSVAEIYGFSLEPLMVAITVPTKSTPV